MWSQSPKIPGRCSVVSGTGAGLTGWVRNLWDDRVEMEVQGTREEIREMVERLSQQSFVEIEGIEEREIPLEEEFGFHVRG